MFTLDSNKELLEEANRYLNQLSYDKLKLAVDFLGYLQSKEEREATEELLHIPNFKQELWEAQEEVTRGDIVSLDSVYRS